MYSKVLKDKRIDDYSNNLESIISNSLRDKFKQSIQAETVEEAVFAQNFAEVFLFVDKITDNENCKFLLSDRHKELMCEGIFSAYEYLNKNFPDLYPDFDKFIDFVGKKLENIKIMENNKDVSLLGKYVGSEKNIYIKSTANDLDENFDYVFVSLFTHEFCHALSNKGIRTGIEKNEDRNFFERFNSNDFSLKKF